MPFSPNFIVSDTFPRLVSKCRNAGMCLEPRNSRYIHAFYLKTRHSCTTRKKQVARDIVLHSGCTARSPGPEHVSVSTKVSHSTTLVCTHNRWGEHCRKSDRRLPERHKQRFPGDRRNPRETSNTHLKTSISSRLSSLLSFMSNECDPTAYNRNGV